MTTTPDRDDRDVDVRSRPIGMFDSGMGGLTVLHQCLVKLPAEDFVYVGDTARFPYGSKTQDELERFSVQIASYLERFGVKLLVVACNSATAAALPLLQERFSTPIVGAVMPGARAAVQSSRYRRIGVLATDSHGGDRQLRARHPQHRLGRRGRAAVGWRAGALHPGGRRRQP